MSSERDVWVVILSISILNLISYDLFLISAPMFRKSKDLALASVPDTMKHKKASPGNTIVTSKNETILSSPSKPRPRPVTKARKASAPNE